MLDEFIFLREMFMNKRMASFLVRQMHSFQSPDSITQNNMTSTAVDATPSPFGGVLGHFLHPSAKFGKLMTKEDGYHVHKTLGLLSVLSFC